MSVPTVVNHHLFLSAGREDLWTSRPSGSSVLRCPVRAIARPAPEVSARMRRIRKTDTKPELVVRRLAHRMGFRYRLHRRDLPGTPDLVFPRLRKIIFVHGCFWHQHDCPLGHKQPSANPDYWLPKLARNVERDHSACTRLQNEGWRVLVIWECETRTSQRATQLLTRFLQSDTALPRAEHPTRR